MDQGLDRPAAELSLGRQIGGQPSHAGFEITAEKQHFFENVVKMMRLLENGGIDVEEASGE